MRAGPISVGRLLNLLKQSVGRAFSAVLVSGEVVDPLCSARGHLYFKLTDGEAEIRTVMWRTEAEKLRFPLRAGDQITVRGRLDVYPPRGDLQLVALALMQSGKGQKLLALEQLKARLKDEGLFDRPRRPLPHFPSSIGVVTSVASAVIHDIYQCVQKRYPACPIILSPSSVSGEFAAAELVEALNRLEGLAEVVIVARGGGSFEELLPFSDEALLRRVAAFGVPVVAAVGHGSDTVLLDFVADHTAPTPTAAAVLVTPDRVELSRSLAHLRERAIRGVERLVQERRVALRQVSALCQAHHPARSIIRARERHGELRQRLGRAWARNVGSPARERLEQWKERLRTAGPGTLLSRGFSMIYTGGQLVTSIQGRTTGEELELHFADGCIVAEIKRVEPKE